MIRATVTGAGLMLDADVRPGTAAYVDADWIPDAGSDDVPALVVASGSVGWSGGETVEVPPDLAPERVAALVLGALARDAAQIVREAGAPTALVLGAGAVARCIERRLDLPSAEKPAAVVEASGDPVLIADATARVADLGLVVLVGEPAGRALALDLYPDAHVRGLTLVGVPRPDLASLSWASDGMLLSEPAADVRAGQPLPRAAWYRLSPGS